MSIRAHERVTLVEEFWCNVPLDGRGAHGTRMVTCWMPENTSVVNFARGNEPRVPSLIVLEALIRRILRQVIVAPTGSITLPGHGVFRVEPGHRIVYVTACSERYPFTRETLRELLEWIES